MTDNKSLVAAFFTAIEQEGFAALPRFATEDVRWWNAGAGDMTISQLIGMMNVMASMLDGPIKVTVTDMVAEGDHVAVEAESYAVLKNSKIYNNKYHFKFTMRDGKIAVVKEYHNTYHAHETFMAGSSGH